MFTGASLLKEGDASHVLKPQMRVIVLCSECLVFIVRVRDMCAGAPALIRQYCVSQESLFFGQDSSPSSQKPFPPVPSASTLHQAAACRRLYEWTARSVPQRQQQLQ
eukprot:1159785-Pelagomonas_calceolata.AAC.4